MALPTMAPFRTLVVLALVFHALGMFAIPHLGFLFSADVKELMKYSGHGAFVNPTHPAVYAFYLLPYPALVAMLFGQMWGRNILLAYIVVIGIGTYLMGASVSGFPDTLINLVALLLDGAILGLAFFAPHVIEPSNNTVEPDARKSGARRSL
jgi:hypothetical protein